MTIESLIECEESLITGSVTTNKLHVTVVEECVAIKVVIFVVALKFELLSEHPSQVMLVGEEV